MQSESKAILIGMLALLVLQFGGFLPAKAQEAPTQQPPRETGYEIKKPVFGGACKICPWGAIADIVKEALKPYGWDVQVCYNCAGGPQEARIVAGALMPPTHTSANEDRLRALGISPHQIPPPPNGPVDFGVTTTNFLWWAYQGTHDFAKDPEGPRKHLRLVALIQSPLYLIVAAKSELGITDLSQIRQKRWPVRILWDKGLVGEASVDILAYYGLTEKDITDAGGSVAFGVMRDVRNDFDVIIYVGSNSNAPEFNVWSEVSQKYDLTYLQLPEDLLNKLVTDWDMERKNIPNGLLRGIERPIPTAVYTGNAIYGRTDMPDEFAYTVARAMDEHQDLLPWSYENYSWSPNTVWKTYGVPLHPGAERYYREKGYMK
jgi:uncharacterized protein